MALFGKKKTPNPKATPEAANGPKDTTYLGQKIKINGTVSGNGNVIILGQLEGKFDLQGELTIAEPARVRGEIQAGFISVKGCAEGTLRARKKLHLEPSAKVSGKVHAKSITMLEGAQLDGELEMSATVTPISKEVSSTSKKTSAP